MFTQLSAMMPLLDREIIFRILRECKKIRAACLVDSRRARGSHATRAVFLKSGSSKQRPTIKKRQTRSICLKSFSIFHKSIEKIEIFLSETISKN
jgi:hypothetical protein